MTDANSDQDSFSVDVDSSCQSESKSSAALSVECLKRGSTKAYKVKAENINVIQSKEEVKKFRSSFDSGDHIDKVLSGESLYKTFTFEQSSNEEDVEKCISFWKSIMHKNLEPIKCSIIENTKSRSAQELEIKKSVDKVTQKHAEEIKNAEARVHEFYKNMWDSTLQEIQKRRLNQIKLIGKSRCKMCETEIFEPETSSVNKEEIVELNSWEPKLGKRGSASRFSKPKPSVVEKKPEKPVEQVVKEKTPACICEPPELDDTVSIDTIETVPRRILPDSNIYTLVDIIKEKKKVGAYSRWRKGVTKPCTCGVPTCDCNKNPAVVSITHEETTCVCGLMVCRCDIREKQAQMEEEEKSIENAEAAEEGKEFKNKHCYCGNELCTCKIEETKESTITVDMKSIASSAVEEVQSTTSKETISLKEGEKIPEECIQQDDIGPIKKDSKADVTKSVVHRASVESEHSIIITEVQLDIPQPDPPRCVCVGECQCKKSKSEEEMVEVETEVLQLQKGSKK